MLGREEERRAIESVLDSSRRGLSGALVVRGEAGMGKTTLLDHAATAADGMRTLRIRGIEAEREFGFAGLQRLCVPLMDLLPSLPERQRDALSSAFGLGSGPPADRFLVGLAALTLLTDAAAGEPIVCLIDDAQWLDQESLDALAFVGRRLLADSVALLFAVRYAPDAEAALEGLPRIDIEGLPYATALELVSDAVATPIDATIADRIVSETGGCPLALEELAKNLSASTLAGGAALPEPLPISGRLESHFLARAEALPPATQLLALLAAAETSGDPGVVWRAAAELGLSQESADPAEAAGLLTWWPQVEFRHPLVRSAVYGGASRGDRRRVHAALAAATDPELDPDGRARHLAAAAIGPDEAVAAELERSARRARSRGGYAADAALMSRSAELTPDPVDQARRRLQAAQIHYLAGAPHTARNLLDVAAPGIREPLLQAQAKKLDAALNTYIAPATIAAVFLRAAQDLEPLDRDLAREAYADALGAVAVSGHLTRHTTPLAVARAALAGLPLDDPDPSMDDLLIEASGTRIASGYTAAVPAMRRLVAACMVDDVDSADRARWWTLGPQIAAELWDAEGFRTLSQRLEQAERERGALSGLRSTVSTAGNSEIWAGRFAAAAACYAEAAGIAVAIGDDPFVWDVLRVELLAWQGQEDEARAMADILTADVVADAGAGIAVDIGHISMTILELSLGEYVRALSHARQVFEHDQVTQGARALPDLVEAAIRAGDRELAVKALERLTERARASGTHWALGVLARASALMAPDAEAEDLYRESIAQIERTYVRTDLARAHLVYGEWLRRRDRRLEARAELQTAYDLFDAMGARLFAERASNELAATGARARRRSTSTGNALTPQESQIAALAAEGATNAEIATKLFLSANTIDYHLRKVYRKVGVSSRRHLRGAMHESSGRHPASLS